MRYFSFNSKSDQINGNKIQTYWRIYCYHRNGTNTQNGYDSERKSNFLACTLPIEIQKKNEFMHVTSLKKNCYNFKFWKKNDIIIMITEYT